MYHHKKITKKVYDKSIKSFSHGRKYDSNKRSKTLFKNFDWQRNDDENLKHEIEFIIKSKESLAENKIKNKIEELLLKYKHGNNIHEHRKEQNEWVT